MENEFIGLKDFPNIKTRKIPFISDVQDEIAKKILRG